MTHPYIQYLETLTEGDRRGALASLRRGLGHPPGTVPEMYRYVVPWVPADASRNKEASFYLVAALYAYHPKSTTNGNMGTHLSKARKPEGDDALERRFTSLLAAHLEDLPIFLRQAISFLKSKDEIPVNWDQLFRDLQEWSYSDRRVQKRWARGFWSRKEEKTEQTV